MDHVALRMPVLILAIAEYFDKLLENGSMTAVASLSKSRRVVVMTVNVTFVLIV
jgi:hypothetical protein